MKTPRSAVLDGTESQSKPLRQAWKDVGEFQGVTVVAMKVLQTVCIYAETSQAVMCRRKHCITLSIDDFQKI